MLCAVCALFSACAVSAAPSGILPQMYKIRAGTGKGRTGEGIRRQSEAVVRRKREQDRERRWGGISRRIGKTAAARARSALFPRITLLKQRNSKSIPPKYTPAARQSGFTRCRRDFGSSPLQDKRNHRMKRKTARRISGKTSAVRRTTEGIMAGRTKKAPCVRGKPNTVRNGVRHARCVV